MKNLFLIDFLNCKKRTELNIKTERNMGDYVRNENQEIFEDARLYNNLDPNLYYSNDNYNNKNQK